MALIWQQDIRDHHDVVCRSKNQAQSYDYDGVRAEHGLTSHVKHAINTIITAKENTIEPWAFVWDIRYFYGSFLAAGRENSNSKIIGQTANVTIWYQNYLRDDNSSVLRFRLPVRVDYAVKFVPSTRKYNWFIYHYPFHFKCNWLTLNLS